MSLHNPSPTAVTVRVGDLAGSAATTVAVAPASVSVLEVLPGLTLEVDASAGIAVTLQQELSDTLGVRTMVPPAR